MAAAVDAAVARHMETPKLQHGIAPNAKMLGGNKKLAMVSSGDEYDWDESSYNEAVEYSDSVHQDIDITAGGNMIHCPLLVYPLFDSLLFLCIRCYYYYSHSCCLLRLRRYRY
jgi:hypothetical protein